jgi:hypothetical protein
VLEFYYVAMLTASDTKSTYLEGEASLHQGRQQLDDLARQVDIMTSTASAFPFHFSPHLSELTIPQ